MPTPLRMPGLTPNPWDSRDVFADEILAGTTDPLPVAFRIEGLSFEPQGSFPFCVSMAVTKMFEWAAKKVGVIREFSKPHLFYWSGGAPGGSNFRANLDTARNKGCIGESRMPMPKDIWDTSNFEELRKVAYAESFSGADKVLGYVRIESKREALKRAIRDLGPLMVGVYAGGGWWKEKTPRQGDDDNHAVLLVGWDKEDNWIVFDSLQPSTAFLGYHTISKDYPFWSVYALAALPPDWREIRDDTRTLPPNNANRYGKPRNLEAEQRFALEMLDTFKKFKNQSVLEAAGRFWEMYIRAGVYGGYNLSYMKWGVWQPGDLVNDCYAWRRTGQHLFNFDKLRNEQI